MERIRMKFNDIRMCDVAVLFTKHDPVRFQHILLCSMATQVTAQDVRVTLWRKKKLYNKESLLKRIYHQL